MTTQPHILVLTTPDEPDLPGLEAIGEQARIEHVRDEARLREGLTGADILVVTDFRNDQLERLWPDKPSVRWVHATSAGVDRLMFPALWESGIPITNARGVFDRGIAEYVLGAVLMFAKDSLGNLQHQRDHRWHHRETELIRDKQVLVVGAGSIGKEVARLLTAAGMTVDGVARTARDDDVFRVIHANESLPELLPEADYVVITAPLNQATEGLFDEVNLGRMKQDSVLINVGRGPIVVTSALMAALSNGPLRGAALDVFEQEPLPEDHPLWDMPQVMISAHMAGDFVGWRAALGRQFAANFERWLAGEALNNRVDPNK